MACIRTKQGTDWPEGQGLLGRLLSALENGNPGYRNKLHLVRSWLIEFDENGLPRREIGLGASGNVVLAGPSEEDYGFWLDTNMTFPDFSGEPVSQDDFDQAWRVAAARDR
jgi:hypothetical protein